jgi:hypothetical protein
MMWSDPEPKLRRSVSLGVSTPFGWEWTDPTIACSFGIVTPRIVACTGEEVVPGSTSTSVTTRPRPAIASAIAGSARNSPMNSSGCWSAAQARAKAIASVAIAATAPCLLIVLCSYSRLLRVAMGVSGV